MSGSIMGVPSRNNGACKCLERQNTRAPRRLINRSWSLARQQLSFAGAVPPWGQSFARAAWYSGIGRCRRRVSRGLCMNMYQRRGNQNQCGQQQ